MGSGQNTESVACLTPTFRTSQSGFKIIDALVIFSKKEGTEKRLTIGSTKKVEKPLHTAARFLVTNSRGLRMSTRFFLLV